MGDHHAVYPAALAAIIAASETSALLATQDHASDLLLHPGGEGRAA